MPKEYTKNELRHRHSQQKAKHEKRKAELEKRGEHKRRRVDSEITISNTQVGKLVGYFRELDFDRTSWWNVRDVLAKKILSDKSPAKLSEKSFATQEEALAELLVAGEVLATSACTIANKNHSADEQDLLWAKKMITEGTLNDKASAAATLVQSCPPLSFTQLESIIGHVTAVNRTECDVGINTFVELWQHKRIVPLDEELKIMSVPEDICEKRQEFKYSDVAKKVFIGNKGDKFHIQRLDELTSDSDCARLLLCLVTENKLVHTAATALKTLHARLRDSVDHTRNVVYETALRMTKKLTLRETACRVAIRFIADSNNRIFSRMTIQLGSLLIKQPALKSYVCTRIEELVWMQTVDALELSQRDAVKGTDGFVKAPDTPKVRLARKAHMAKQKIREMLKKSDVELRSERSINAAHTTVCNAFKFLSEVTYTAKEEPFVKEQLLRYLRILSKMMEAPQVSKLARIQARQIKFIHKQKKGDSVPSQELKQAISKVQGDLVNYVIGLGSTQAGSVALRHVLLGLQRILPYCSESVIKGLVVDTTPKASTSVKNKRRPAKKDEKPAAKIPPMYALSAVAGELMKAAHRVPCMATRVHAWCLCYSMYKLLGQQASVYGNLYAQLKDFRYMQTSAKNAWLRLHLTIISDYKSCPADVRSAYLRRLFSVLTIVDMEAAQLPIFMVLDDVLRKDETAVRDWIAECLGVVSSSGVMGAEEYSVTELNPTKSHAMESAFWEMSLAKCSMVPSVSDSYAALAFSLRKLEEGDEVPSVMGLMGWNALENEDGADEEVSTSKLYKTIQHSQSLTVLYRLLSGQTLGSAVKAKSDNKRGDKPEEDSDVWSYDIYNTKFWECIDSSQFGFPFRRYIEPTFRYSARERFSPLEFEDEVDKHADQWIMGCI